MLDGVPGIKLVEPMGYDATVRSVRRSPLVLTDSGGLQEEAPCLGKPVLVMRARPSGPRHRGRHAGVGGTDAGASWGDRGVCWTTRSPTRAWPRPAIRTVTAEAAARIVDWLLARLRDGVAPDEFRAA